MPKRGKKQQGGPGHVALTGLDARIYWENRAALEAAHERLWDVHGELALELASAIREVFARNAPRLFEAVDGFNAALDDVAVQLEEVAGGVVGSGSNATRDAMAGIGDRLFERRVLLSPVQVEVDEVELDEGHLVDRSVDVSVRIPCFGRAVVQRGRGELDAQGESTAWDVYYDLPIRPDSGNHF